MLKSSGTPEIAYQVLNDEIILGDGTNPCIDINYNQDLVISTTDDKIVRIISSYAFKDCTFTTIILPDSITSIGNSAFQNCLITNITLGPEVTTLGSSVFSSSKIVFANLSATKISTDIGESIFYKATLEEVLLPETLEIFTTEMFAITKLTKITFPRALRKIQVYAFLRLYNLNEITSNSPNYVVYDGIAYTSDFQTVVRVCSNTTHQIVPSVRICDDCSVFSGCLFESYTIECRLEKLGNSLFRLCPNLTYLDISKCICTYLPTGFVEANTMKTLILPDTIRSIGD